MALLHLRTSWQPFGVLLPLDLIAVFLSLICFSVVLFGQFRLSLQRQQVIAEDLKQAQEMQQLLIPDRLPRVPGWSIETEYRPAREVGGDFFQIIPHPSDGSILIVAGDVAGKGLQAGMLVAMLVGAIRTESTHSSDPIQMLKALNGRLCGEHALCGAEHAQATCLVLLIDEEGKATLANAGHLPPYLNGTEISIKGSLPLGMLAEAEFATMDFQMNPGDRLVLISDGIVEAQNERGDLFGFDRIRILISKQVSAAEIAITAQAFGQQDDISVLSIVRMPVTSQSVS
jgi:serine phosphatase RsbU (regulator of sigma subunit)